MNITNKKYWFYYFQCNYMKKYTILFIWPQVYVTGSGSDCSRHYTKINQNKTPFHRRRKTRT